MTFWQGVAYVLRHAWLWPLEFWLRPLDVIDRIQKSQQDWAELGCALVGGAAWGAAIGILLWLWSGDAQAIWAIAVAGTVAVTYAVAFTVTYAVAGAVTYAVAVAGAVTVAFAGAGAGAGAFAGAFAGVVAGAGARTFNDSAVNVTIAVTIACTFAILIAIIGIGIGISLPDLSLFLSLGISFFGLILIIWFVLSSIRSGLNSHNWADTAYSIIWVIGIPITAFSFFPQSKLNQVPIWGLSLVITSTIGISVGFYHEVANRNNLQLTKTNQTAWLVTFWSFFSLLALAAWLPKPSTPGLNDKLDLLALFFAFAPPVFTGLIVWPLTGLIALGQFRTSRVSQHTEQNFAATLPLRWQTFAYPLPGLRRYLAKLCSEHGPEAALNAIQTIQLRSLQIHAARRAALDLAADPDTVLPFCGQVAIATNAATLAPLSLASPIARAITVLAANQEKENEQPLQLYAAEFPPRQQPALPFLSRTKTPFWIESFRTTRQRGLLERIDFAIKEIRSCPTNPHLVEFHTLLETLSSYTHVNSIQGFQLRSLLMKPEINPNTAWLHEGWRVANTIQTQLAELEVYRNLDTPNARREFLERLSEKLQALSWDSFSEYWSNIGKELIAHWVNLLAEEAKQAREWLRLDVQPIHEILTIGQQTLQLQIRNPTTTLARDIRLCLDETPGLEWHHTEVKRTLLEGGKEALMSLELETREQGSFRITGRLDAEDLAGNPLSLPFAFQLRIAQAGQRYRLPRYQPYITGEGLGDDRTFAGRKELLHWLRGLWLQPDGKPAVALVGQRRIGKTSLLNKIKRDGLPDTQLLPILVNIQGVKGDYDFLNSSAREMAAHLKRPRPALDRANPYPDFKDFLLDLKPQLARQRFLLMLDEADLIPQRQLGDSLPGFLRALMQEPEYPTLLLFCGTHALKRMSLEYSSILFNTAQFRTVSYMSAAESAEVLTKPARNILEFDPAALDDAYRLTRGQPLLLQSLGATLINHFDAIVLRACLRSPN